jgi:hypothetical protein
VQIPDFGKSTTQVMGYMTLGRDQFHYPGLHSYLVIGDKYMAYAFDLTGEVNKVDGEEHLVFTGKLSSGTLTHELCELTIRYVNGQGDEETAEGVCTPSQHNCPPFS